MRCLAVFVLVASVGCADRSDRRLQQTFEAARLAMWRGDFAESHELIARGQALSGSRSAPASAWLWKFRNLEAEAFIAAPDLAKALPLLEEPIPPGPELDGARARQRYLLAKLQVGRGALHDARRTLDSARELLPADDSATLPDVEALDGQIYFRLGQWAEGEPIIQRALSKAIEAGDRYREAVALNDLGMARLQRNRCDEAVTWFERVMHLPELERLSIYGKAMNNAGSCLARLGQFERALAVQRTAVSIHEGGSRIAYEQALGELGTTHLIQGDLAQGLPLLIRALNLALDTGQKDDAANWARNLASAHVFAGQWDQGELYNNEARRLTPASATRSILLIALHSARIAGGRGHRTEARRLFAEIVER